jgi:phage shock protein A
MNDLVRILAAWALVHESADEGWKAAVERGRQFAPGELKGADAFVDGLAALVAEEKERLKASIASPQPANAPLGSELGAALDAMRFELAELRGRIESLQASVDAIAARGKE